jgi:hypothetical protein
MGRIKSRSVATAAKPAGSSAKRPRARRARAAGSAPLADHAKPQRLSRAAPDRTPVAGITPAIEPNLAPPAQQDLPPAAPPSSVLPDSVLPSWQYTAAMPVAEPSLWQELSQPILRRIARRKRQLSMRATQQFALMRLAARRTQRRAARAWEGRREQLQAVQRDLRRRRHDLAFIARRKLHRIMAAAFGVAAPVWRETQARRLRAQGAAQAWLRRTFDSARAGVRRILAHVIARIVERVIDPVLRPMRSLRPPQRETVAIALAALAVLIVSVAWLVIYSTVAPTRAVSTPVAPVAPPAPAKAFTERVIAPVPAKIDAPVARAPATDARAIDAPAEGMHDVTPAPAVVEPQAALPSPAPPVSQAAPAPAKRKVAPHKRRHRAHRTRSNTVRSPVAAGRTMAPLN